MAVGVTFAHQQRQFLAIPRCLETFVDRFDQLQSFELVGNMPGPFFFRCQAFAEVVQQAGPAHGQRLFVQRGLFQHAQGMYACVDFRMVGLRLRYAEQCVDLRHQHLECAASTQHFNEYLRLVFHQGAGDLFPAPLRRQCFQFARLAELAHQLKRFGSNGEAEPCITCSKAGNTQNPERIFGKRGGYVAQNARFKVALAVVGVGQFLLIIFGYGIDRQVAADQVFFEGHFRAGVEGEPAITASAFAFGSGEGVFLTGFWMKENREIRAYRAISLGEHLFGGGADHDTIDVGDRDAQQAITHRTANFINPHKKPPLARQDNRCVGLSEAQTESKMDDGQVQPAVIAFAVFASGWHMVGFHHLIPLQGFQMNVEAPETMQMLEHFLGGFSQRFAVVLLVAQGQRAVAATVDAVDLHVGFAVAQVVLRGQGFTDDPVAALVVNRWDQQVVLLIVIENAEQLEVADHLR
ncbi:hypothetical protein D3C73_850330 [compost metagenome]